MGRPEKKIIFDSYVKVTEPNHELIAKLATKAKGNESLNAFARRSKISAPTLSRLLNAQIKTAISDEILLAIAENADPASEVTIEQLLEANGMAKKEDGKDSKTSANTPNYGEVFERISRDIIQLSITAKGYRIAMDVAPKMVEFGNKGIRMDYAFETNALSDFGIDYWAFDAFYANTAQSGHGILDKINRLLSVAYISSTRKQRIKLSLVTNIPELFEMIKNTYGTKKYRDVISIILVDTVKRVVANEYQFPLDEDNFTKRIF